MIDTKLLPILDKITSEWIAFTYIPMLLPLYVGIGLNLTLVMILILKVQGTIFWIQAVPYVAALSIPMTIGIKKRWGDIKMNMLFYRSRSMMFLLFTILALFFAYIPSNDPMFYLPIFVCMGIMMMLSFEISLYTLGVLLRGPEFALA